MPSPVPAGSWSDLETTYYPASTICSMRRGPSSVDISSSSSQTTEIMPDLTVSDDDEQSPQKTIIPDIPKLLRSCRKKLTHLIQHGDTTPKLISVTVKETSELSEPQFNRNIFTKKINPNIASNNIQLTKFKRAASDPLITNCSMCNRICNSRKCSTCSKIYN